MTLGPFPGKLDPSDEARSALTAPNREKLMASTEYASVEAFLFARNGLGE